jgi:hypothetical protein
VRTFESRYNLLPELDLYRRLEGAHGGQNFECVRIFEKMAGFCVASNSGVDSVKCAGLDFPSSRDK